MKQIEDLSNFIGKHMAILVLVASGIALAFPPSFTWASPHITTLLSIVMFGMGLTLKASDFQMVLTRPIDVFLGTLFQFTIMPCIAFILVKVFGLPDELAIGVILVGCCPGGTSSNVMTFLAKGDIALSVTITSVSTVLAPICTPILIKMLAGASIDVELYAMFLSIVKVVIVPITLGLIVRKLASDLVDKIVVALPMVSVISILLIVGGVVSTSQEKILTSGLLVAGVVIIHNTLGYMLGYFGGKFFKLKENKCRTLSIEVGMQNSGLGVSLATQHFSPEAAIPGAIFSVWHNISGAIMANFLANRKTPEDEVSEAIETK